MGCQLLTIMLWIAGRWMAFFCLQPQLLLVEAWLQRLGRQAGIRMPRAVRTVEYL